MAAPTRFIPFTIFVRDALFIDIAFDETCVLLLFQKRKSDRGRVVLQDVNLHTSGKYKCEVSAEAPNFHSVNGEANMEVIGEWTGVAFN